MKLSQVLLILFLFQFVSARSNGDICFYRGTNCSVQIISDFGLNTIISQNSPIWNRNFDLMSQIGLITPISNDMSLGGTLTGNFYAYSRTRGSLLPMSLAKAVSVISYVFIPDKL